MCIRHPVRPRKGFFDEVQDFTALELKLVRKWGKFMDHFLLAGDDDQCIYSFKGATPEAFLLPRVDEKYKRVLSYSYRLPKPIYEFADKWIHQLTIREQKEFSPRNGDDGMVVHERKGTYLRPEPLIENAVKLTDAGFSVMFLASCGYILNNTIRILRQEGIPFHNPYRQKRKDWNPLGKTKGVSAHERILAYLRPEQDVWDDLSRIWTKDDLSKWVSLMIQIVSTYLIRVVVSW